jgi:hypothetical protein
VTGALGAEEGAAVALAGGAEVGALLLAEGAGALGAGAEVAGAGVVAVLVSGSTYCWSPAEVVVPPWASAVPAASSDRVPMARQRRIRKRPLTRGIEATTASAPALQ